ncbi:hypothetical protein PVAP13_5NG097400 [Panicum virgatum]|uniref:Replication factor A C-terminal domain-containing protein n=1 Tax=Panicum virgatum TaxID=38727 RepID=A0A8T0RRA3_PANVG|nr:hypothetical protein PVAP13_5NG097400 [Panicum virgatum]
MMFLRGMATNASLQIISTEGLGEAWKWKIWRNISFRNICLCDLRGRKLNVALFGDLGRNFDAEQVFKQSQNAPIVAVFAGMLVRRYAGKGFTVCSTSASKYYLDLDIPQVQEFHASLTDPHKPILLHPCQPGTTFLCRATLKGIDCTKGWFYWSCFHCKRSISRDGINSLCIQGCPKNPPPVPRYKLNAVMEDMTGAMDVMIFDDKAQELVGAAAEELV